MLKFQTDVFAAHSVARLVMPLGHFLCGAGEGRKAPLRNPRSPVETITRARSIRSEQPSGSFHHRLKESGLKRQNSATASPAQIAATAAPSRKPRFRFT